MENFIYSIAAAVIGLGLLIVFHEFGHFLLAKLSGVGVLTFSVGFGPKLWVKKKGETEYAISAFPLGGYVKMVGEDPDEEVQQADIEKSFAHKSLLKRIAIVVAGPGFNLLLAVFLFMVVFTFYGVPVMSTQVSGVEKGSPAERAGIAKGDRILAIDGDAVKEWEELSKKIKGSGGRALNLQIRRGEETKSITVQPTQKEGRNILGDVSPRNIGGPILIAQMAGQQAQEGLGSFLAFLAVLSINLGVLNLLPVPVLDGGHLLFFLVEAVIRKPVAVKYREVAQQVGICLLALLMVYAFYNDIVRFFEKQVGG